MSSGALLMTFLRMRSSSLLRIRVVDPITPGPPPRRRGGSGARVSDTFQCVSFSTMWRADVMARQPTTRDLEIWQAARHDLMSWQYGGVTGLLQRAGHRTVTRWARPYASEVVLEIGCGQGHHLLVGGGDYRSYVGLDMGYDL